MKKILAVLLAMITMFSVCTCLAHAEATGTKSLYYNTVSSYASISSGGLLTITNYYTISSSAFTSARIKTYVERKVLGLIWVKVDNGQPDKTWIAYPTAISYQKQYTLQLSQTGTYRVTAEYTFYGSNGTESITRQPTATY